MVASTQLAWQALCCNVLENNVVDAAGVQIPVGLTTPVSVLDELVRRVDTHLRANKGEWTGKRDIAFREITDTVPIRMIILVACQLSHTSARRPPSPCHAHQPEPCVERIACS